MLTRIDPPAKSATHPAIIASTHARHDRPTCAPVKGVRALTGEIRLLRDPQLRQVATSSDSTVTSPRWASGSTRPQAATYAAGRPCSVLTESLPGRARVQFATAAEWVDRLAEHYAARRLQDERWWRWLLRWWRRVGIPRHHDH